MRGDGWAGDGDGDSLIGTEPAFENMEGNEFAGTAAIASVIMVMMVALLLVHALA
jgi:hypothetical protein